MENLEKEIREGIEKIYKDQKKLQRLQEGRKKLFLHL